MPSANCSRRASFACLLVPFNVRLVGSGMHECAGQGGSAGKASPITKIFELVDDADQRCRVDKCGGANLNRLGSCQHVFDGIRATRDAATADNIDLDRARALIDLTQDDWFDGGT